MTSYSKQLTERQGSTNECLSSILAKSFFVGAHCEQINSTSDGRVSARPK